jgi:hypothetical protein
MVGALHGTISAQPMNCNGAAQPGWISQKVDALPIQPSAQSKPTDPFVPLISYDTYPGGNGSGIWHFSVQVGTIPGSS